MPRLSLRLHLVLVVLTGMIPLLMFSTAMVLRLSQADRNTFSRGATERTLALITAVDTELKGSLGTLQALAASNHLDTGNLLSFRRDAERVLVSQRDWLSINLAEVSGQQLLNLHLPPNAPMPMIIDRASFDYLVKIAHPVIGNLKYNPDIPWIDFSIRVPVMRDGLLKYVLSASVSPQSISALLLSQRIPSDWMGAVIDGNGRFVGQTLNPQQSLGQLAPEGFRSAVAREPEGWFRGKIMEGRDVYIAYNRSPLSGWTVGLAIPAAIVETTLHRSLFYTMGVGIVFLAIGLALAWSLSLRAAGSIEDLSRMAESLGLNKEPADIGSSAPIAEVEAVREVLFNAARTIQERSNERDRVEASLRRVSQRLELAQEAAEIGTFERDLETNVIQWSRSMEMLYGVTSGAFGGTYEHWRRLVHPEDIDASERAVQGSIQSMAPLDIEFRIIRPDGAVRWVASRARIVTDGESRRMVGVNIDITERKRAEEELQGATSKLREADRHKNEFLAMLGHELRNPLNVISATVQLLDSEAAPEPRLAEFRGVIAGQVSHMARLVDDLLDISRISHGQIRLTMQPCDLAGLVRETLNDHRRLFTESGIAVKSELPNQPVWVIGDSTRLKQVIGNGLQNANKFTERGGTVSVTLTQPEGEKSALLSIRDTGVGMDAEMLRRAFEPFSQAEQTLKRSRGGLGLGLALVKGIIDLHRGSVSLQSRGIGAGSELLIRLPLTGARPAKSTEAVPEPPCRPCRILLIEDNRMGARAMHALLSRVGHEVQTAYCGSDGQQAAQRFQPDVIICDIGLPDMDGFEVARALRREPTTATAYLIALTGFGEVEYQRQALEAGFDDYLTKPVGMDHLTATLSRATIASRRKARGT